MKLATNDDGTRLFESDFQWLITRLAKKLPSHTDVNLGFGKFHRVASSSTNVGTWEESIGIDVNTSAIEALTI